MRLWKALLCCIGLLAALSGALSTALTVGARGTLNPAIALAGDRAATPTPAPQDVAARNVAPREPRLRLRYAAFDPRGQTPVMPDRLRRAAPTAAAALRLIQFPGPIQDAWIAAIDRAGLEIVTYLPDYAYLVWGTSDDVGQLATHTPLRWHGAYEPAYAIHPETLAQLDTGQVLTVTVQLFDHAGATSALRAIEHQARQILRPPTTVRGLTDLVIRIDAASVASLAQLPEVVNIEPAIRPALLDEVQGQLIAGNLTADGSRPSSPGYLAWLTATVGFTTTATAYPIVDITDDGIDDGTTTPLHPDFYTAGDPTQEDRLVYNINWTTDPTADGGGGHGNINAAIVGGYNDRRGFPYTDGNGYNRGLGVNPFGPIAGSKVFGNVSSWGFPNYIDLVSTSYNNGARIISNSWGESPGTGAYMTDDRTYDALVRDALPTSAGEQPVTIVFAAGNAGNRGANTTGSPANAKNVITVGASENYRPTWTDGCGIGPSAADNANDIAAFSSRGPTDDGRVKPDLVAPGTHIQGAASQSPNYPSGPYVCDAYHPPDQLLYAASSGTSHATPGVAGAASLLTYFYQHQLAQPAPSPAMIKAYLINSAQYLDGVGSGDTLPSNAQGYGAVNLGTAFDTTPRLLEDQAQVLHTTGETVVFRGVVAEPDRPFRVTLAWTDPPGATVGAAYVNDLDLAVEIAGQRYFGNVFAGAHATTGGAPDFRNNVESVFLPAGIEGSFTITVTATNLAGDGVPDDPDPTDQDFALVCYNCQKSEDLTLRVIPTAQTLCQAATGVYTITPVGELGRQDLIALSVSGIPADTLASIAPNPVIVNETSQLAITTTAATLPGSYTLQLTGRSPSTTLTMTTALTIASAPKEPVLLLSPDHTSTGLSTTPTLSWAPTTDATHYIVEIATDAAFSTRVYTATTVATTHTLAQRLDTDQTYLWRVISANGCGLGAPSTARSFTVGPALRLGRTPPHVSICPDATAHYTVTTTSAETGSVVTLRLLNPPLDAVVAFDSNPLIAGNHSRLTVEPAPATPTGAHTLHISGETLTTTETITVGLSILPLPEAVPALISPGDAITGVATTPTLSWQAAGGATHYIVQVATAAGDDAFNQQATRVYSATTVATTHTLTEALSPGTAYYWRVLGVNSCGVAAPSPVRRFEVQTGPALAVAPTHLDLCRGATGQYTVSLPVDATFTGEIALSVQGIPDQSTAAFAPQDPVDGLRRRLLITTTAETPLGAYTLHITGVSETEIATGTAQLTVLTTPSAPVRLLSPGDVAVDIAITPLLSWEVDPDAAWYVVEIATDPAFSDLVYTATTSTTQQLVVQALRYANRYYWRVISANVCGQSLPSASQTFTTIPFRLYFPIWFTSPTTLTHPLIPVELLKYQASLSR